LAERRSVITKLVPVSMMTAVVAADVGIVEHDVVAGESPDPGGGGQQWIDQSR